MCVWSFTYYLCERYYKPITVQCHIVICVSWVSRLTLLDLPTNWTYKLALRTELIRMLGTYCILLCWVQCPPFQTSWKQHSIPRKGAHTTGWAFPPPKFLWTTSPRRAAINSTPGEQEDFWQLLGQCWELRKVQLLKEPPWAEITLAVISQDKQFNKIVKHKDLSGSFPTVWLS